MATDVEVPALGESITEGTLAQWLKKPGEAVAADEPIASLETDKVSVEVPSPVAGVLTEQLVGEGDKVAVGAVIARIDQNATAGAPPAAKPGSGGSGSTTNPAGAGETPALRGDAELNRVAPPNADGPPRDEDQITTLSPAVRRAVLEYHVDPTSIRGTGKDGRLTKDDVIAAAQAQKVPSPAPAMAPAGESAGSRSEGSASCAPAFAGRDARKSASRCRASARRSPSASRKRRTPPPC